MGLAPEMTKDICINISEFPKKVEVQGEGHRKSGYYGVKGGAVYTGVDSR